MTDEEIICRWMEYPPSGSPGAITKGKLPRPMWWTDSTELGGEWQPQALDLDLLHIAERRLIAESRMSGYPPDGAMLRLRAYSGMLAHQEYAWHAPIEARIKALAFVVRPLVERL